MISGQTIGLRDRAVLTLYFALVALVKKDIGTRAASTTYTFVFSLVPLLTTTIAFMTSLPGLQDQRSDLEAALFQFFVSDAARSVQEYIDEFAEKAAAAGAVSSLVFFVTTLLLLKSVEQAFNYLWHVENERTWAQRIQVLAVTFVVGSVSVLMLVTLTGFAQSIFEGDSSVRDAAPKLLVRAGTLIFTWLVFALANVALPNAKVQWRSSIVGALIAGTAWHYLKDVFTWYVASFTSYENIYGALGTVPVFLLWVYLSFFLLFIGAEIAYVHQHIHGLIEKDRIERAGFYPRAYFAVGISIVLAQAYKSRFLSPKMTISELATRLSAMPLIVEESLAPLVRSRLVLEVAAEDEPVYLLGLPAEQLTVGEVARSAVGDNLDVPEGDEDNLIRDSVEAIFTEAKMARNLALDRTTISELVKSLQDEEGAGETLGGGERDLEGDEDRREEPRREAEDLGAATPRED